jgi:serralysin
VKAFSGATNVELRSFLAYAGVNNEVRVASGDVNGDGFADIITGLGAGAASHVKVFDGTNLSELASFFAYGGGFTGGVYVAAGDVNHDGRADIITGAGVGGNTHVKVFNGNGLSELASFIAYPGVTNEVRVGSGDVDGDGFADIITGVGPVAPAHVKVFRGNDLALNLSYFAYPPSFTGGVYVAGITPVNRVPECSSIALVGVGLLAAPCRRRPRLG